MTTKTKAKSTKAAVPAVLGPSPCLQRGPEMPTYVYAHLGEKVDAFIQVCAALAAVTVSLHRPTPSGIGGTPLFDGKLPPNPNPLVITLPPLQVGVHLITWTFTAAGFWDIAAEVHVSGVARFRKINSNPGDKIPVNAIWSYVEVVA
jgi:hypothetical protein